MKLTKERVKFLTAVAQRPERCDERNQAVVFPLWLEDLVNVTPGNQVYITEAGRKALEEQG